MNGERLSWIDQGDLYNRIVTYGANKSDTFYYRMATGSVFQGSPTEGQLIKLKDEQENLYAKAKSQIKKREAIVFVRFLQHFFGPMMMTGKFFEPTYSVTQALILLAADIDLQEHIKTLPEAMNRNGGLSQSQQTGMALGAFLCC